jgi:hypothetical protein
MSQHILSHLHKILPQEHVWKMNVLQQWETILGPLSKKVVLQRIDSHAVVLAVAHPGLAQELLLLSDLIRSKINAAIGHEAITTIHFKTATERRLPLPAAKAPHVKAQPAQPKASLSPGEHKQLSAITNKELREALADFYATCKERTAHENKSTLSTHPRQPGNHSRRLG